MKFKHIATLFLAIFVQFSIAQKATTKPAAKSSSGFTLKIKANGFSNSYCFFAHHFGAQKFKTDSIPLNAKGEGVYKDTKEPIKGGIYMIVFPTKSNQYVEMIISEKEKNIEVIVDSSDFTKVVFKNSEENDIFYSDVKFLDPYQKTMMSLTDAYKAENDPKKKADIRKQVEESEKTLVNRRLSIINTKPNLFYAKILNLMRDIDVPEAPVDAKGKVIDSNFRYYYFKSHYFDYTDFNDDRILYTPIFENKFNYYFDKLIVKHPDSIKDEVDYVLNKIKDPSSNMMRYCLSTLLNQFANSKIMGQDALYVHLVKNYYQKGKAPWADSATTQKMIYDAEDLEPTLIGKVAQDFKVFDTSLVNYKSLYEMTSPKTPYTLVAFWSADCGHCKKEIPVLDSLYPTLLKEGVDVFAVSTVAESGDNVKQWKDFVKEKKLKFKTYGDPKYQMYPLFKVVYKIKGTPEYLLIDNNHKIIAKKLSPEQIVGFIQNYKKDFKRK